MKSRLLAKVVKEMQLRSSRTVPLESLRTVCAILGPYRNLTTLTASTLFLHPECQVLNHAGQRVFGDQRLDFISDFTAERFDRFCRYAIRISATGQGGLYGGSITRSHAFRATRRMKSVFSEASLPLVKPRITSLVWKESMHTSNHLRQQRFDFAKAFSVNDQLRFLQPIRNPLDCAVSNIRGGKGATLFPNVRPGYGVKEIADAILDEYVWFLGLRASRPDRFCYYFDFEPRHEIFRRLAGFLELEPSEQWLANATNAFEIKSSGYEHAADVVEHYRESVEKKLAAYPEFADKLLVFNDPRHPVSPEHTGVPQR